MKIRNDDPEGMKFWKVEVLRWYDKAKERHCVAMLLMICSLVKKKIGWSKVYSSLVKTQEGGYIVTIIMNILKKEWDWRKAKAP